MVLTVRRIIALRPTGIEYFYNILLCTSHECTPEGDMTGIVCAGCPNDDFIPPVRSLSNMFLVFMFGIFLY
jgi:hypothetical protein